MRWAFDKMWFDKLDVTHHEQHERVTDREPNNFYLLWQESLFAWTNQTVLLISSSLNSSLQIRFFDFIAWMSKNNIFNHLSMMTQLFIRFPFNIVIVAHPFKGSEQGLCCYVNESYLFLLTVTLLIHHFENFEKRLLENKVEYCGGPRNEKSMIMVGINRDLSLSIIPNFLMLII